MAVAVKIMDETTAKTKIIRLIFAIGFILPLLLMTVNFTYDEYWSLLNFSPLGTWQILTDLSLPNNHPLNTFSLKILSYLSYEPVILRLPSLICGALIPCFCGVLAYKFSQRNKLAALISAALLALLSAPLVVYSAVARGYVFQLFFLLLCVYGMSSAKEVPLKAAYLTAIGSIGTILSVSNGALFLLPAGMGYLLLSENTQRKSCPMWISAGVIALFAGIFYGINFSALRSGQAWGVEITGLDSFGMFLESTFLSLILVPSSLASLFFFVSKNYRRWIILFLLFLPFLLAVFSNGGPARCYLYLPAALAVAGGIGLAEFTGRFEKWRYASIAAALLLGGAGFILQRSDWQFVDYAESFSQIHDTLPLNIYPVFRASAGFPVRCGIPERVLLANQQRLNPGTLEAMAFFECDEGIFNGLDGKHSEEVMSVSCRGDAGDYGELPCFIYPLHRTEVLNSGECGIIIGDNIPQRLDNRGDMLYLNSWITLHDKIAVFRGEALNVSDLPGCRLYRIGK